MTDAIYQFYFEKLHVWQNLRLFTDKIYKISKTFPVDERYNLTSQIRRAVVSSLVNLAEGSTRSTKKDQANFTAISYSSLMEVLSLIIVSYDQQLIDDHIYASIRSELNHIANQLNALKRSQLNQKV